MTAEIGFHNFDQFIKDMEKMKTKKVKNKGSKKIYTPDEEGNIKLSGKLNHNLISDCYLIERTMIDNTHKLYIAREQENKLYDVLTSTCIGDISDDNIVNKESLEEYLLVYNIIKENYNYDDLTQLLSTIENDYQYHDQKQYTINYDVMV